MRYKCIVSYDGTNFHGFQSQNKGRCIQTEIEKAISLVCKEQITIYASGRTDAHVHAIGQVFHFDTNIDIKEEQMRKAINSFLPNDIYIKVIEKVSDDFHSRYNTHKKEYHYLVDLGEYNPLYNNYRTYYLYKKIDFDLLIKSSKVFIGEHDFRSFSKNQDLVNTVRTIYSIDISKDENNLITFKIIGNGFLHNQVRIMCAMMLEVARGKISVNELQEIMNKKNRVYAPKVLSPNGLYLYRVYY